MKLFNKRLKNNISEKQLQVSASNDLWRSLYQWLPKGTKLRRDDRMDDYIKEGYEQNPDTFSISNQIAGLFARVPVKAYINDKEIEDPLLAHFESHQADYTYHEFKYNWEVFNLISGNAIVYCPKRALGNNAGKFSSFDIMPTQNTEIVSGGWRKPVGMYTLDLDNRYEYEPNDVWHTRMFPNLDYSDGKNFMGISPVKVAAMIILAQNAGYEMTNDMLSDGIPQGILSKIEDNYNKKLAEQQEDGMRRQWRRAGKNKLPLFTLGNMQYTRIGYDNLKDLQVIENSQNGMKVLCNVWGVPVQSFNNTQASTENNVKQADKAMYKKRIIPDVDRYAAGLTKLFKEQGIIYKGDYSGIEALQEDKKELATALKIMVDAKLIGRDEARRILNTSLNLNLDDISVEGMTLEDMLNEPAMHNIMLNDDKSLGY